MSENNNKSLYIYTALIFIVAVVLIIVSFFGQSKLAQNQPVPISNEEVMSITERAAVVSNENKVLLEENISLKQKLQAEKETSASLKVQNEVYKAKTENLRILLSANSSCAQKKYSEALEAVAQLNEGTLSDDERALYNSIKAAAEKADN